MGLYPAAVQKPLNPTYCPDTPIAVYNRVNLHTQAGNGSLFGYFNQSGKASSHFWVAKSGLIEQYQDTAHRAEADLDGNDATISIETEGNTEPWTDAQLAAIIALVTWICDTHTIPKTLATNAFSGSASSRGISWHRLGIDGNFPAAPSRYAGRKQLGGGMHYSNAYGKVCPGDPRIDQIYDIVAPALSGGGPPPPNPKPPEPHTDAIATDGWWGSSTTSKAQAILGTEVDGEVWYQYQPNAEPALTSGWVWNWSKGKGSPLISKMQQVMKNAGQYLGSVDGVAGPEFYKGLQRRFGTPVDGQLWGPSPCVTALQTSLNAGKF